MISEEGQKLPVIKECIQEKESPPRVFQSVFANQELKFLKDIHQRSLEDPANCAEKLLQAKGTPLGQMAHPKGSLKKELEFLFREKLQGILDEPYQMAFSFHRNYFPYGIHTDASYDSQTVIYKQGIVPLEVDPVDAEVYTVIFKQKCYHSISYPNEVETIRALSSKQLKFIEHLSEGESEISDEELEAYWQGEASKERLKGFSVDLAFRWLPGDMAMWDRSHLHCSSDFAGHGVNGKLGLMWITERERAEEEDL